MPVVGADIISKNIIKFGGGFIRHVNQTMGKVRVVLDKEITKNISLKDHKTEDLRKLGHPYASRWGTSKAAALHEPYWVVHSQTGELLGSKFSGVDPASIESGRLKSSAFVGLNENIAKHAVFVIFGTSKMIPRPVLQESRGRIIKEASEIIKSNLKNLVTSFEGEKTR